MSLRLVQLIADNAWGATFERTSDGSLQAYDYRWMHSAGGGLARTVDGIGPPLDMVVAPDSAPGAPRISNLEHDAQAAGLVVHPYTFRAERRALPAYAASGH